MNLITIKTDASISKLQYPKITKDEVVKVFYDDLYNNHHSTLKKDGDRIIFSILTFDPSLKRYSNKFGNYSSGYFNFKETDETITVTFYGELKRGLYHSGVIPIFTFIGAFLFIGLKAFIFPLILWPIIFGVTLLIENISKPLYITHKIYRIEEKLRDE